MLKNRVVVVLALLMTLLLGVDPAEAKVKNFAPQIKTFSVSKTTLYAGETITLAATAVDRNKKDRLYYEWTVTGSALDKGSISNRALARTYWKAPIVTAETTLVIQLKVTDSKKAAVYRKITVRVKPKTLTMLYNELKPSVVTIRTASGGLGTGFVISANGRILTCYHVIKGEKSATVTLANGATYAVTALERYSPFGDWAIIKVNASNLKPVAVTTRNPAVGEQVFTIGNPAGLQLSLSSGIISNNSRQINGGTYLQHTVPTNPGNSGGPLFNMRGQVVGIVNMKYRNSEGLNFAIPYAAFVQSIPAAEQANTPLSVIFSEDNINAGLNEMTEVLMARELSPFYPLTIADTTIGEVYYTNGTYFDENLGSTVFAVDVTMNYSQFLNMYSQRNSQIFNDNLSYFSFVTTNIFSDAVGARELELWYRVYEVMDSVPTEGIVPPEAIKQNQDGKYVVDWYFYGARLDQENFDSGWVK